MLGEDQYTAKRIKTIEVTSSELGNFTGQFYSPELDVIYQITQEGKLLKLQIGNQAPLMLKASDLDQFTVNNLNLRFQRENTKITGFELDAGRVQNIQFKRK